MRNKQGKFRKFSLGFKIKLAFAKWYERKKYFIAAFVWGLLIGSLLGFALFYPKNTSLEAVEPIISDEIVESTKPFCIDVVGCIRDIGESQNRSNKTIMTMIRIAKKESNYRETAKNKSSTARGVFQILAGTWYSNNCVGDPLKFQDNITCAYKILDNQGFPAWEVCNNKSVNCY